MLIRHANWNTRPLPVLEALAAAAAKAQPRRCFAWRRDAAPLARFRVVVGLALCLRLMRQQAEAVPLFEAGVLFVPWQQHATTAFCSGIALAGGIVIGAWPRLCAALLLPLAISTQRALAPVGRLDDWASVVILWWLVLLPGTARHGERARPYDVAGATIGLLLAHVIASYACLDGLRALSPEWQVWREPAWLAAAVGALPALYLISLGPLRWLGPPAQLALHGYLASVTGEWLAHAALAATSLLWIGDRMRSPAQPVHALPARIDGGFAVAACCTALWVVAAAAGPLGAVQVAGRAERVLSAIGLMPQRFAAPVVDAAPAFQAARSKPQAWSEIAGLPDADSTRTRLLVSRWIERADGHGDGAARAAAEHALRAVARRYCDADGARSGAATEVRIIVEAPLRPMPRTLASFDCQVPELSARFVSAGSSP
jgi:hypothetical protein